MVLDQNLFVEAVLPGAVQRQLSDEEMNHYREPVRNPDEGRRPTLSWPRNIPIEGEPADVVAVVNDYGKWLAESDVPKLFINGHPGALVRGRVRDFVRSWPNQTKSQFPECISSRRTAQMRSARQCAVRAARAVKQLAEAFQGRASKTRLNGVSAARRNRVKPPSFTITSVSRRSPACAPSAGPCCASETGTQMSDDAP